MDYSTIANLPNLQPGSTGTDVTTLQKWLVANGYLTQAQMNTGPGTYGPQTTAAVAKWQSAAGINTQGNPGYFGPISKAYITNQSAGGTKTAPTPTQTSSSPSSAVTYDPTWAKYGVTQAQWAQMSPTQQGVVAATLTSAKSLYAANASDVTVSSALAAAAKDPNLVAKYSDALKLDKEAFSQTLGQLQQSTSTSDELTKLQFEKERRDLAAKFANAGEAYSGFRTRAQGELAVNENAVIQSSRMQQKQQLDQLTSAFEAKYGTKATPAATLALSNPLDSANISYSGLEKAGNNTTSTMSGQTAGGITGTQPIVQSQDTASLAASYVQLGQQPPVATA